jgi:hypothetical protein
VHHEHHVIFPRKLCTKDLYLKTLLFLFLYLDNCIQMVSKNSNKHRWSFYYFSKKPLPNFITFGLHLNHQLLQTSVV